jgi:hypothetical protein
VSAQTPQVKELLVDMKLHNKNYVYVDIKYFTDAEFMKFEVLPSHVFNMVNEPYGRTDYVEKTVAEGTPAFISPAELSEKIRVLRKSSFVFENEYDYVGGIFELYQRIYQDDEEVMEISPPVIILDRR